MGNLFGIYELKHPSEKDNKPADTSTDKTVTSMFLFFIDKYKLIAGYLKSPHPFGQKVGIIQAVHYGIATEHMGFNDKKIQVPRSISKSRVKLEHGSLCKHKYK